MSLGIRESAANIQAVKPIVDKEEEGTPCPKCGKPIVWTRFCIHCGYDTQPPNPRRITCPVIVVLALIALLCGSCGFLFLNPWLFS